MYTRRSAVAESPRSAWCRDLNSLLQLKQLE